MKIAIEEGVIDINVLYIPVHGDGYREDNMNCSWLDNGIECIKVVNSLCFLKTLGYQIFLVPI